MTDAAVASAQWTERLYPPAGGQDHLGLGSVSSDRILPKLSPGIIVQTVHPRYLSFYTFLLDEFWRRDLPRTRAAFSRFLRPREAIFAIGAHLCDRPEHGQGGLPATSPRVRPQRALPSWRPRTTPSGAVNNKASEPLSLPLHSHHSESEVSEAGDTRARARETGTGLPPAPPRTDPLAAALAFAIREAVRLEAERATLIESPDRANVVLVDAKTGPRAA